LELNVTAFDNKHSFKRRVKNVITHGIKLQKLIIDDSGGNYISDEPLANLSCLTSLRYLALQGTGITTKTFDRLSQLKQLKAFNYTAADTPGSDAHLPSIIRLTNLAELSLEQGSVLSAAEMKEIGKMTNLTSLSLMTESEKDSVTELVHLKGLQHLTVITVSSNVSSAAILNTLSFFLRKLKTLQVSTTAADDGLKNLSYLTSLSVLRIQSTNIGNDGVGIISSCLTNLTELELECGLGNDGLANLTRLTKLHTLNLGYSTRFNAEGVRHLASMSWLRVLNLEHCAATIKKETLENAGFKNLRVTFTHIDEHFRGSSLTMNF
jgi:hypothetical protein